MWSLLGVCPYLIRDPVPKCDDFRMVAISRSVDEVVAPLDVQFRFRQWGDETPLHEVLGYQDTSPQRDAYAPDSSFDGHAAMAVARAACFRIGHPNLHRDLRRSAPRSICGGRTWVGLVAAFGGIALVAIGSGSGVDDLSKTTVIGVAWMLVSAVAIAFYYIWSAELTEKYGALPVAAWNALAGLIAILPLGLSRWPTRPTRSPFKPFGRQSILA